MGDLVQREHPKIMVEMGVESGARKTCNQQNSARQDQAHYDGLIGLYKLH